MVAACDEARGAAWREWMRRAAATFAALAWLAGSAARAEGPAELHVATFDSGFGGFLTAKSIEREARPLLRDYDAEITIHHYGDTANLPYGEKSPDEIAALGSAGVLRAFADGADMVFIACNTASTQYERIRRAVDARYPGEDRPVVSIIDVSTTEAKRRLDAALARRATASLVVMATPATVRSMTYPRRLAALYGVPLAEQPPKAYRQPRWYRTLGDSVESLTQRSEIALPGGRRIEVVQLAPANWVELIEHGADLRERRAAVRRDLGLLWPELPGRAAPDVVGYFCTHYP
ncbi:MAG: aspartate/glutamate racemase family protein, partial [Proteobacteria bacterium]|nr:aspartate/glutamate racemase family protein [Pseudomonadota bacterium]